MKYKIRLARLSDTKFIIRTLIKRYGRNFPSSAVKRGALRRTHILPRLFDDQCNVDVNEDNIASYCNILINSYSGNLKLLIIDENNSVVFIGTTLSAFEWSRQRFGV